VADFFDSIGQAAEKAGQYADKAASTAEKLDKAKKKFEDLFKKPGKPKPVPEPNLYKPLPQGNAVPIGASGMSGGSGIGGVIAQIFTGKVVWIILALVAVLFLFMLLRK
jgi:hypothetical protein